MTKYEQALELFGTDCSVSAQDGFIKVILSMKPSGNTSKLFATNQYFDGVIHPRHLVWFLHNAKRLTIRATSSKQISTWEFGFDFEKYDSSSGSSISARREFHVEVDIDKLLSTEHRIKKTPYIQSPDFDPNDEESRRREYRKIAEWIDSNQPERNTVNFNGIKTWNSLKPLMDKVASTVAIGVWEKQPPTPSMETAYFSWELEVDAGQTKTVRIAGNALDSLKSAISIADSTSLEFGCYSGGSGLTVIIGVDDTFTE